VGTLLREIVDVVDGSESRALVPEDGEVFEYDCNCE
jgi:hypothetical protein